MSLENLSLEACDELAALAQTLAENPNTRKDFLRMTKQVKPDLPIPELEIEEYTRNTVSKGRAGASLGSQVAGKRSSGRTAKQTQFFDEKGTHQV